MTRVIHASTAKVRVAKVKVTEANIRKTAARLLASSLVSPEMSYVRRELAVSVTQAELDAKVVAVRALPWNSIVLPEQE